MREVCGAFLCLGVASQASVPTVKWVATCADLVREVLVRLLRYCGVSVFQLAVVEKVEMLRRPE